jgi:hypothetical protein
MIPAIAKVLLADSIDQHNSARIEEASDADLDAIIEGACRFHHYLWGRAGVAPETLPAWVYRLAREARWSRERIVSLEAEVVRLQRMIEGLCGRVATQSELLTRRAEK